MERDINEFRQTRERQLQEQAMRMREGIVKEMKAQIEVLGGQVDNLIFDKSGNSLNGVPVFLFSTEHAERSEQVIEALNQGSSSPFAPWHGLRLAVVDMNKVFKGYTKTKDAETKIDRKSTR